MGMATALRRYVIRRATGDGGEASLIDNPDIGALEQGEIVARAITRWALVRMDTGRPVRIPQPVIDDFVTTTEEP
jgi:hypothetical protein